MSNWEKSVSRRTTRENGTCKACKRTFSRLVLTITERTCRTDIIAKAHYRVLFEGDLDGVTRLPGVTCCGERVWMRAVEGRTVREIPCGARCLNSKGHTCDCSCGGKNHGAGFSGAV